MSAEVLRRAAALMRERASDAYSAVDDGDWRFENIGWNDVHGTTYTVENHAMPVCEAVLEESAVHIASWHPRVALAVANLLDHTAEAEEQNQLQLGRGIASGRMAAAVLVARAYLGEQP